MIIGSNLLRLIPTTAPVAHRAVLDLRGSQASQFLNGILATVVHATPKGPFFSAFLHAQAGLFFFKVYFVIKSSIIRDESFTTYLSILMSPSAARMAIS
jgi:transferase CAF17, mitochondrial